MSQNPKAWTPISGWCGGGLTCVDGLLHMDGAVGVQHLLVVLQPRVHLESREPDPQEGRHVGGRTAASPPFSCLSRAERGSKCSSSETDSRHPG